MNETDKGLKEVIKKENFEATSRNSKASSKASFEVYKFLSKFRKSNSIKHWYKTHKKQNDHDMLQANQASLKCSTSYVNNFKQVININSTIRERYQSLHKLSIHHILTKGN